MQQLTEHQKMFKASGSSEKNKEEMKTTYSINKNFSSSDNNNKNDDAEEEQQHYVEDGDDRRNNGSLNKSSSLPRPASVVVAQFGGTNQRWYWE